MGSLGHYFISQAAKRADTVVITPFQYTSFYMGHNYGVTYFYNEIPSRIVVFGGLLIFISGVYIMYREHIKNKQFVKEGIIKGLN